MIIESSAPTRVDIAGGTIDIPPLFLFHEGAATVNFAISLMTRCRIETRADDKILIESLDRREAFETSLGEIGRLKDEPRLKLLAKLIYFFKPEVGFSLITESEAPAGAGLAGSSALNIACIGALNRLVGNRYAPEKFITIAANVECQVIEVPTGFQDYYSAQYGGAACIHFRPDGIIREGLTINAAQLEKRIVVLYTGEPRNSGINNWEITKRHIDGDKELFNLFESVRDTSLLMRDALLADDWEKIGDLMREAFPRQKKLAPTISTPQMDFLIKKAETNGAIAAKVCGAGGGGCIAFYCEEGAKENVEKALAAEEGAKILDWKFCAEGLVIKSSRE